jgi:hypothetical protein
MVMRVRPQRSPEKVAPNERYEDLAGVLQRRRTASTANRALENHEAAENQQDG